MDINTKLKKLLEDSGQRQAEVAQKCGLTPANLSRALTRDHNLNLSTVLRIADGIGLELRIEDANGNRHQAADPQKFAEAAADTSLNWDDVEAILSSLGFYLEFDWR